MNMHDKGEISHEINSVYEKYSIEIKSSWCLSFIL